MSMQVAIVTYYIALQLHGTQTVSRQLQMQDHRQLKHIDYTRSTPVREQTL